MDKRDHYIKRCVGLPGDSLQIINRQLYIDGKPADNPNGLQYLYHVKAPNGVNTSNFTQWGVSDEDRIRRDDATGSMLLILNEEQADKIRGMDQNIIAAPTMEYTVITPEGYTPQLLGQHGIDDANYRGRLPNNRLFFSLTDAQAKELRKDTLLAIRNVEINPMRLFPQDPRNFGTWTVDNFGPIYIPKAGATVKLNRRNIALYQRIINVYEGNDFEVRNGKFLINGQETDSYTFKMNYYWMMGDNRHNSRGFEGLGIRPGRPCRWPSTVHLVRPT